jgi:predicted ATP-binding protein involved in virulence
MTFKFLNSTPAQDFDHMLRQSSLAAIRKLAERQQAAARLRKEFEMRIVGWDENSPGWINEMYQLTLDQRRELDRLSSTPSTKDLREIAEPYLPEDNDDE